MLLILFLNFSCMKASPNSPSHLGHAGLFSVFGGQGRIFFRTLLLWQPMLSPVWASQQSLRKPQSKNTPVLLTRVPPCGKHPISPGPPFPAPTGGAAPPLSPPRTSGACYNSSCVLWEPPVGHPGGYINGICIHVNQGDPLGENQILKCPLLFKLTSIF